MKGKSTRGRRIQMLHYLANDDGYAALKRAAETHRNGNTEKGCQKLLYSRRLLIMVKW